MPAGVAWAFICFHLSVARQLLRLHCGMVGANVLMRTCLCCLTDTPLAVPSCSMPADASASFGNGNEGMRAAWHSNATCRILT